MKIVIDVNLWISFAIGKRLGNLEMILKNQNIQIFHTEILLDEINNVIQRPKLRKYINLKRQEELLELILTYSQPASIGSVIENLSRDSKDNYLLTLCQKTHADFLLTGDNDLLILKEFGDTKIWKNFARYQVLLSNACQPRSA